jgi:Uma2 family endonuclease
LSLAPLETWWDALRAVLQPPSHLRSAQAWMAWAAQLPDTSAIAAAGPHFTWMHARVAALLRTSLDAATDDGALGLSIGRGFVMRLGDNGLTPDLLLIGTEQLHRVHEMYLDGPADLLIEITLPGHERDETVLRRRAYAAGGVPEYWIVDPVARTMTFLRLADGTYHEQPLMADGSYRPAHLPGLVCVPDRLWDRLSQPDQRWSRSNCGVFEVVPLASAGLAPSWDTSIADDSSLPFAPVIGRQPRPISFEQYIAWCPEAKFERIHRRIEIGHWQGTRNVLGLLLLTFGLDAAVSLLHPRTWVAGLLAAEAAHRHDAGRRDHWWTLARQAADILRERFGVRQVAVIGDLVRPAPLHYWSQITLVVWDMPKNLVAVYVALAAVSRDPKIELINERSATRRQRAMIAHEVIFLTEDIS